MEITGTLSEFPLPELLQLLDRRHVTGCLSLDFFSNHYPELHPQNYAIWLEQGHITGLHRGSTTQDIYSYAVLKEWISPFVARKMKERSPQNLAAGLYLESQGVLNYEQLRSLFFDEVVYRVESLCKLSKATFDFHTTVTLPMHQMTGLRVAASKIAMQGFQGNCVRHLEDFQNDRNRQKRPTCAGHATR